MLPFFVFSYLTSTRELKNVLYMYVKLSFRTSHTYIERSVYCNSSGVSFLQIGNKWTYLMGPGLESLLNRYILTEIQKNRKSHCWCDPRICVGWYLDLLLKKKVTFKSFLSCYFRTNLYLHVRCHFGVNRILIFFAHISY